jgi:hypothetical protein
MSKASTNLEDYLSPYEPGGNDSLENRPDLHPYLNMALQGAKSGQVLPADAVQEYVTQGWDASRTINIPLIDNHVATINQAALTTCEASVTAIDTAVGTLTSLEYNTGFTMDINDSYVNSVKYGDEFRTKRTAVSNGLATVLNSLVNTNVEAIANTYFPAQLQADYWPDNTAGDAFLIPNADYDLIYNELMGVMREMNFDTVTGQWIVMCSTKHFTTIKQLMAQGSSNATNTSFQFGPFTFIMETALAAGEAVNGQAMVIVPNTFGLWNTNAPDVVNKSRTGDGKFWDTETDPFLGLTLGTLFSSKCDTAKSLESYQYYTKVTFFSKYNSDPATRYSPWLKLEVGA